MSEPLPYKPFGANSSCPRCKESILLGYHRHLDPSYNELSLSIKLPSGEDSLQVFGTKALSTYDGRVLYLGVIDCEGGKYDTFCCGNCWLEHLSSPVWLEFLESKRLEEEAKLREAEEAKMEEEEEENEC